VKVRIKITQHGTVPLLTWKVRVENDQESWEETLMSRDRLAAFLCGVKVGLSSQGVFDIEEVRRTADGA